LPGDTNFSNGIHRRDRFQYLLESDWSAEVLLLVGRSATDLTDELGVLDYSSHIIDAVVFGVLTKVLTVFTHA